VIARLAASSEPSSSGEVLTGLAYQPGVCNIGPEEIARRRRSGHVGLIATIGLFAVLVLIGAPPIARLLVGLPAMIAASGYLQAWLKFCAGFGTAGIYNFGSRGQHISVADAEARRKDRVKSLQISLTSFAVGAVVGVVAVLLSV
jgi:hypothetical protein